jgi:hypothetical protein
VGCPAQDINISSVAGPVNNGSVLVSPVLAPQMAPGESRRVLVPMTLQYNFGTGFRFGWSLRAQSIQNPRSWNAFTLPFIQQ